MTLTTKPTVASDLSDEVIRERVLHRWQTSRRGALSPRGRIQDAIGEALAAPDVVFDVDDLRADELRDLDATTTGLLNPIRDRFLEDAADAMVTAAIRFARTHPTAPLTPEDDAELAAPAEDELSDDDIDRLADAAANDKVRQLRHEQAVRRGGRRRDRLEATDSISERAALRAEWASVMVTIAWTDGRAGRDFEDAFTEAEACLRHIWDESGLTEDQIDNSEYLATIHRHVERARRKAHRRLIRALTAALVDVDTASDVFGPDHPNAMKLASR